MTFEPSQNENRSDGLPWRSWSGMTSMPCPSTVPTVSVPTAWLERNAASGSAPAAAAGCHVRAAEWSWSTPEVS